MSETRAGTCKLCGKTDALCDSHVIPAFVYKYAKATSATDYFRFSDTINRRVQDGIKLPWLCAECEGRLSVWEKQVAEKVFVPYGSADDTEPAYGPWMLKFAVSVSWRATTWFMSHPDNGISPEGFALIKNALSSWRDVLLENKEHPGQFEQHVFLFGLVKTITGSFSDLPTNLNRFLTRGTHINLALDRGLPAFIYVKMYHMTLLGFISMENLQHWRSTRIGTTSGVLGGGVSAPESFYGYLQERARVEQAQYELSEKQKHVIGETVAKNPERAINSDLYKAMERDREMFGAKESEKLNDWEED